MTQQQNPIFFIVKVRDKESSKEIIETSKKYDENAKCG